MPRKRKQRWTLLYREEGTHRVHLYEPLRKYEIRERKRQGWKVIKNRGGKVV